MVGYPPLKTCFGPSASSGTSVLAKMCSCTSSLLLFVLEGGLGTPLLKRVLDLPQVLELRSGQNVFFGGGAPWLVSSRAMRFCSWCHSRRVTQHLASCWLVFTAHPTSIAAFDCNNVAAVQFGISALPSSSCLTAHSLRKVRLNHNDVAAVHSFSLCSLRLALTVCSLGTAVGCDNTVVHTVQLVIAT